MSQLQSLLVAYHSAMSPEETNDSLSAPSSTTPLDLQRRGFAVIDEVSPQSPAMSSGIKVGDILLSFGAASLLTAESPLSLIPKIVSESVNKEIDVKVLRGDDVVIINIIPSVWGGRGLLGCHLKPI
jgi:26S proteasome non-ATPase regulatory subunit 9